MKQVRVLIADRQELAVAGIVHLLKEETSFKVIATVRNGAALDRQLRHEPPDILAMDYATLDNFPVDTCKLLQKQFPSLKLVILTADTDRERILRVLQSGVFAFLTKDCSQKEILNAFRAVTEGQKFYCNSVLEVLTEHTISPAPPPNTLLSRRERQIVQCIAQDLSTKMIATRLNLSPHTINAHRKRILKKLGAKSPVGLIVQALRLRLISLDEVPHAAGGPIIR